MKITMGTHDELLDSGNWIKLSEKAPRDYADVYLRCMFGGVFYVVIGQLSKMGMARVKSDGDPELFHRSAIVAWKGLYD